jgi:hypothetical protein
MTSSDNELLGQRELVFGPTKKSIYDRRLLARKRRDDPVRGVYIDKPNNPRVC